MELVLLLMYYFVLLSLSHGGIQYVWTVGITIQIRLSSFSSLVTWWNCDGLIIEHTLDFPQFLISKSSFH